MSGREPARPNHEVIHDGNLQYDDDEDSGARQPEIKGLVDELFVGLGHWTGRVAYLGAECTGWSKLLAGRWRNIIF